MGGITIPCSEHTFLDLTSRLSEWVNTNEVNVGSKFICKSASQDEDEVMIGDPSINWILKLLVLREIFDSPEAGDSSAENLSIFEADKWWYNEPSESIGPQVLNPMLNWKTVKFCLLTTWNFFVTPPQKYGNT
jgi:hypothetical protein